MEGLMVACLSCLAILLQFHGVFCVNHIVDHERDNEGRTRRYHENDCPKERLKNEQNKMVKSPKNVGRKPKSAPKPALKAKLPINERNEPKDIKKINHILKEIANVAHNHNETRGIQKIRHLVDEIAKQEEKKTKVGKPMNTHKEKVKADAIVLNPGNHLKPNEIMNKLPHNSVTVKMVSDKDLTNPIKAKDFAVFKKPPVTSDRRINNEMLHHVGEAIGNNNDYNEEAIEDENLIEINEHKYEEEMLRSSSYNNNQASTYTNWCMGQNTNPEYYQPYDYKGNDNGIESYEVNNSNYPTYTYGVNDNQNGDYYIVSCNENAVQSYERKEDFTTLRKTWLDRDTKIAMRDPGEYVKTVKEDRKEITREKSPDFYRKYYCYRTKQYSNSNRPLNDQYTYYMDPYHCS